MDGVAGVLEACAADEVILDDYAWGSGVRGFARWEVAFEFARVASAALWLAVVQRRALAEEVQALRGQIGRERMRAATRGGSVCI